MIYTVGIGSGEPDMMPYKTVKLLMTADVIAGSQYHATEFQSLCLSYFHRIQGTNRNKWN
jgi:precorrin-6B methylase 1